MVSRIIKKSNQTCSLWKRESFTQPWDDVYLKKRMNRFKKDILKFCEWRTKYWKVTDVISYSLHGAIVGIKLL